MRGDRFLLEQFHIKCGLEHSLQTEKGHPWRHKCSYETQISDVAQAAWAAAPWLQEGKGTRRSKELKISKGKDAKARWQDVKDAVIGHKSVATQAVSHASNIDGRKGIRATPYAGQWISKLNRTRSPCTTTSILMCSAVHQPVDASNSSLLICKVACKPAWCSDGHGPNRDELR